MGLQNFNTLRFQIEPEISSIILALKIKDYERLIEGTSGFLHSSYFA